MLATVVPWVGYALWHLWFLRRRPGPHPRWLLYLSCTIDLVVVAAGYLAAAQNHTGIMEYWRSQTLIVFAFWNLLSGLRLNPTISLYSAALTAALNFALLLHTVRYGGIEVRLESVYSLEAINVADQVVTILFVSIPGLVAAVIAARTRTLLLRAESEALMRAQVERHRDRLGRYLPRFLVDLLLRDRPEGPVAGTQRQAIVLFFDIRGFTSLAESHAADRVVAFLNQTFDAMVEVVVRHGGSLDKFLGDGFMATFGAPRELADAELRAVLAAVEMHKAHLERLGELEADGFGPVEIGVGIASGPVICGDVGSHSRMEFTCIGDTVNLASRLERFNRHLGTGILVCPTTASAVGERLPLELRGAQTIRGRKQPVEVYSLDPDSLSPAALGALATDAESDVRS